MRLLAVLGIVGATLVGAGPAAWAATAISLDPAQLPITAVAASQLASTDCGIASAGATDADIWVFRVNGATTVESLTATFASVTITAQATPQTPTPAATPETAGPETPSPETPSPTATPETPVPQSPTSGIVGTDAWVAAPAGDELTGVTADVDGDGATLTLLAACPAKVPTTADPLVAMVPQVTPTTRQPGTAPATQPQLQTLPVAGTNVAEIAELGAGMVLTGVLLILFRGRRPKPVAEPEEDDIRRPMLMTRRF